MTARRLAAAALLAVLAACGVKAPPRPPVDPGTSPAGAPATTGQGTEQGKTR